MMLFIFQERFSKKYRHPVLDVSLTSQRTKSEARTIMRCRMNGNVNWLNLYLRLLARPYVYYYLNKVFLLF